MTSQPIATYHIEGMIAAASAMLPLVEPHLANARGEAHHVHGAGPVMDESQQQFGDNLTPIGQFHLVHLNRLQDAINQLNEARKVIERLDNLVEHAAAELRDELLRARDGWPFV
jgi:hypothetical protein